MFTCMIDWLLIWLWDLRGSFFRLVDCFQLEPQGARELSYLHQWAKRGYQMGFHSMTEDGEVVINLDSVS
jgi:hypothetical protein